MKFLLVICEVRDFLWSFLPCSLTITFINMGINSWFVSLQPWSNGFVLNERVVWMDIEGLM